MTSVTYEAHIHTSKTGLTTWQKQKHDFGLVTLSVREGTMIYFKDNMNPKSTHLQLYLHPEKERLQKH